jgi:hypothetical protein
VGTTGANGGRVRLRWKRLLVIPLLGSVHACDCGSCLVPDLHLSCGIPDCGFGGQCSSDGACAEGMQPDPTTSCGDGGGFCCVEPPPTCAAAGGVCLASCPAGGINGDCGRVAVCCVPPGGDDGASDAGPEVLDAQSTDADDAPDTGLFGSCNGSACAGGCTCEASWQDAGPTSADAGSDGASPGSDASPGLDGASPGPGVGGGTCVCAIVDASADAEGPELPDAGDAGPLNDASADAETSDAVAARDASADASEENDAAGPCGVIFCATRCSCTSRATSACVCP